MISEDFAPAAGVASRCGDVVKRTELQNPKSRLTRLEFQKHLLAQRGTAEHNAAEVEGNEPNLTQPKLVGGDATKTRRSSKPMTSAGASGTIERSATPPATRPPSGGTSQQHHGQAGPAHVRSTIIDRPGSTNATPQPVATMPQRAATPDSAMVKPTRVPAQRTRPSSSLLMSELQEAHRRQAATPQAFRTRPAVTVPESVGDDVSREFLASLTNDDFYP